jgi:hypothetical protein
MGDNFSSTIKFLLFASFFLHFVDGKTDQELTRTMPQVPPYGVIEDALKSGNVVAFLGSAASAVYRPPEEKKWKLGKPFLPFGAELAEDLAAAAGFPEDESVEQAKQQLMEAIRVEDQGLIGRVAKALDNLILALKKSDLPLVASYYSNVAGDKNLNSRLRRVFMANCRPGTLHRLLASIENPLLIVTTNYDDMMERAYGKRPFHLVVDRGDKHCVWFRNECGKMEKVKSNILGKKLSTHDYPIVYKLHGCLDRDTKENDHFLISEEHYVEFLGRGAPWVPQYLWNRMEGKSFLFLGYSLSDWNIRVLLQQLREAISEDIPSWAITRHPGAADEEIWKNNHRILMFDCDLVKFAERLAQTMNWSDPDNE